MGSVSEYTEYSSFSEGEGEDHGDNRDDSAAIFL
jgi:hypothetical protein